MNVAPPPLYSKLAAAPQNKTPVFTLMNACPFPIFIREAVAWGPGTRPGDKCEDFGETPTHILPPGEVVRSLVQVRKDSCGHSDKSSMSSLFDIRH